MRKGSILPVGEKVRVFFVCGSVFGMCLDLIFVLVFWVVLSLVLGWVLGSGLEEVDKASDAVDGFL